MTSLGVTIDVTKRQNKALDAEPPIASFVKSTLIGDGPVNAIVIWTRKR
jgi:hypothetical protein